MGNCPNTTSNGSRGGRPRAQMEFLPGGAQLREDRGSRRPADRFGRTSWQPPVSSIGELGTLANRGMEADRAHECWPPGFMTPDRQPRFWSVEGLAPLGAAE